VAGVDVAIGLPAVTSIDPRELVASVVQDGFGQPRGRPMECPPDQDGRAFVGPFWSVRDIRRCFGRSMMVRSPSS
jgi:hypothetical protein